MGMWITAESLYSRLRLGDMLCLDFCRAISIAWSTVSMVLAVCLARVACMEDRGDWAGDEAADVVLLLFLKDLKKDMAGVVWLRIRGFLEKSMTLLAEVAVVLLSEGRKTKEWEGGSFISFLSALCRACKMMESLTEL